MKKLFSVFTLATAVFALTSCSQVDETPAPVQSGSHEIRISAQVGDYTRVEGTSFESGDQLTLSAYKGEALYIDAAQFTYAEGQFTGDKSYYWPEEEGAELAFYALYPANIGFSNPLHISAQLDQTTHEAYSQSDVMVAYKKAAYSESAVNLTFARQHAKLVFNLDNQLEEEIASLKVSNLYNASVLAPDAASETGYTLTESTDAGMVEFTAAKLSLGEWVLIVPAQKAAKPVLTVVTASGVEYKYEVTNGQDLVSGYYYTANIKVEAPVTPDPGPDPEPEPDPIAIEIAWSIADWEAGDELEFIQEGVEQEPEVEEPAVLAELDPDSFYTYQQVSAGAVQAGKWYALVGDSTYAATALSGNYGYLPQTAVIAVSDGVVSAPAACAFGFLTVEGGYTIQQYDGKYLYQTGTYNSFNVSADLPAEGQVWTVEAADGLATITNTSVSKWIQYSASYSSYGSYNSVKGVNPALYELVAVDTNPHLVNVSVEKVSFMPAGGTSTVTVTTYGEAELLTETDADWFTVSVADGVVSIEAAANEGEARKAKLTISYGEEAVTLPVTQEAPVSGDVTDTKGTFTSMDIFNYGVATTSGSSAYSLDASTVDGGSCNGFKLGTSKLAGVMTSGAVGLEGDYTLGFYAVAWSGKTATLYVRVNEGDPVAELTLNANTGATGNPPYTITSSDDDYYTVQLTGLTATDTISFSTDATFTNASNSSSGRAVVYGVQLF